MNFQPSIILCQLSDDPWYTNLLTKLNILQPIQIIVPQTVFDARTESTDAKLMQYIREQFPNFAVNKIPRRHFSDTDGLDMLNKYCSPKYDNIKPTVTSKYYALSALSALLKYLEHFFSVNFVWNTLKVEFEAKYGHMLIGEFSLMGSRLASAWRCCN